jgi:hypothetical protein
LYGTIVVYSLSGSLEAGLAVGLLVNLAGRLASWIPDFLEMSMRGKVEVHLSVGRLTVILVGDGYLKDPTRELGS